MSPPLLPLAPKARGQMHCQIVEVYYIEFKFVMTVNYGMLLHCKKFLDSGANTVIKGSH